MADSTSNHTLRSSSDILTEPLDIWYWIIRGIIAVLTITGNGRLIIYFITCRRHLRVTSNWFVLSLAIAKFCIGLFVTPSEFACRFYFRCDWYLQIVFYNFLLFSSTTNLWAMTIDRYLTNRFHVAVRLFSNRSQMTSKCGKNKKVAHEAIAECVIDVLTTF